MATASPSPAFPEPEPTAQTVPSSAAIPTAADFPPPTAPAAVGPEHPEPAPTTEPGPSAVAAVPPDRPPDRPPTEAEARWLRSWRGYAARELAEKVRRRLLDDRVVLSVGPGEVVEWRPCHGARGFPPEAAYWMVRLKPHLLAILRGEAASTAEGPEGPEPAPAKAAPPVPAATRADVRARIASLPGNPDKAAVAKTARVLASALGPHENEGLTVATFMGLAGAVRRKDLAEGCLQDSFEAPCGKKRNRGGTFIDSVKHWKRSAPGRERPPAEGV